VKTARNVVLKRLSATAECYIYRILYFCISVRSSENQGGPYQDDNYLLSSRKDQKNMVNSKMSSLYTWNCNEPGAEYSSI
jgi:hypothetical protein